MCGFAKNANTSHHNVQQITANAKVRLLVKQHNLTVKIITETIISKLTVLLVCVQPLIKIYLKDLTKEKESIHT